MEKVLRFDRKMLKGVHRLFRGVHFYLGGCKRQRGCKVNHWGAIATEDYYRYPFFADFLTSS